jgi:hypothetical protein
MQMVLTAAVAALCLNPGPAPQGKPAIYRAEYQLIRGGGKETKVLAQRHLFVRDGASATVCCGAAQSIPCVGECGNAYQPVGLSFTVRIDKRGNSVRLDVALRDVGPAAVKGRTSVRYQFREAHGWTSCGWVKRPTSSSRAQRGQDTR